MLRVAGSRVGCCSNPCTERVSGSHGVLDIAYIKIREGFLRPQYKEHAVRFTAGVKQLAMRL